MTLLQSLYAQAVRAMSEPRAAAADVLQLGMPREALMPALFLVTVLSGLANSVSEALAPNPFFTMSPFQMVLFLAISIVIFSFILAKSGQVLGGVGQFNDALLLMIFLQAMFLPAVALQLVLFLILPALSGLFMLGVMVFLTWVHVNFIAALHGYPSLWRALGVLVIAVVISLVCLSFIAPMFVTPTEALSNV